MPWLPVPTRYASQVPSYKKVAAPNLILNISKQLAETILSGRLFQTEKPVSIYFLNDLQKHSEI